MLHGVFEVCHWSTVVLGVQLKAKWPNSVPLNICAWSEEHDGKLLCQVDESDITSVKGFQDYLCCRSLSCLFLVMYRLLVQWLEFSNLQCTLASLSLKYHLFGKRPGHCCLCFSLYTDTQTWPHA
jgi:hypothetical protein